MLVNSTTDLDGNQNPTVRFAKLQPTTTKLDKHLAKMIVMRVRTLIPRKPTVPFVTKDNTKTRMINQIVKFVQRGDTMNKLEEPS